MGLSHGKMWFFRNSNGSFKGAALLVYRDDPEQYWTFITPEDCNTGCLSLEMESDIGQYPKPDEPLIRAVKFLVIRRLNQKGVRKRIEKIVRTIGL